MPFGFLKKKNKDGCSSPQSNCSPAPSLSGSPSASHNANPGPPDSLSGSPRSVQDNASSPKNVRVKCSAEAAKTYDTLNGAFIPEIGGKLSSSDVLAKTKEGRRINIRWPRGLIAAVFNFRTCIVTNKVPTKMWMETPLKDLTTFYKYTNFNGKEENRSIGALFALVLRSVSSADVLYWLRGASLTAYSIQGGKRGRKWLQDTWNAFLNTKLGRADFRPIAANSFRSVHEIMFNVLQAIMLLRTNKADGEGNFSDFGKVPVPMPSLSYLDLRLESNSNFAADCIVKVDFAGKIKDIGPWGLCIKPPPPGEVLMIPPNKLQKTDKDTAALNWEIWNELPLNEYITVTMLPEKGTPGATIGPVSHKVMKPKSTHIDFNLTEEFSGSVCFAESLGDEHGIHYHYRTPLAVYAQRGFVLVIKNVALDVQKIIPSDAVKDLDMWLFENTKDTGSGWANLEYLGMGEIKDKKLVNTRVFDGTMTQFVLEQIPRQRKEKKEEDAIAAAPPSP